MATNKPVKAKFLPMHTESPQWKDVDDFLKAEIGKRRPKAADIERIDAIADLLKEEFPVAACALDFNTPFQLLCATILSAQCTDERVNMVTPNLWKKYPEPIDLMNADDDELREVIRSTGFFNSKAKALKETARQVVVDFGGVLPSAIEELTKLRGAARKTANVLRMHSFGIPGISVDTHVMRLSGRLQLTKNTDPVKIEGDLAALLPPERWTHFANALILHGRKTCNARAPKCEACVLQDHCPSAFNVQIKPAKKKGTKK